MLPPTFRNLFLEGSSLIENPSQGANHTVSDCKDGPPFLDDSLANADNEDSCQQVQNGKDTLEAIFTLPANYLDAQQVRKTYFIEICYQSLQSSSDFLPYVTQIKGTGIILGHSNNASEWKGKLLTDIAVHLAMQGAAPNLWNTCFKL